MQSERALEANLASINGVAIARRDEVIDADTLRQRACAELLRQAAIEAGLLATDDVQASDGVQSEAASAAIETLLEQQLDVPEPLEEACRRHHAAHQATYTTGERVNVRHILFAVTPGVDLNALRKQAEATLLNVRCHDGQSAEDAFAKAARTLSNCPSGAEGGQLGWLTPNDCAPEFAKELFGNKEVGVLPRLVHSRFGLHVVEVLGREAGVAQPFESVQGAVRMALKQHSFVTALRQYLRVLAGAADVVAVDLEGADTPLVQ
ncbi:MAG: peptidylprolyl isomerase [Comamonadaceae bacterium CG_4_9_14_0_8_um_filter_60_18]|nr:MAG: peptidylprolyl isomerase [Comamonadaceae bacterium CG2_30_60_41]PIW06795.1 MAG: peptidylprolyl isomerase [Comamonadaceae bacterium CG17_big_fil_post_rev_8_21_14_2_50_60_13]PJC11549.1 MAG: peptidylprolyl isomerase [Comamonadaceae bacterium CG_4_9_14_0_8_um_filter_60_18]